MNNSREATPEQLQRIWDLAEQSKDGAFGMPTNVIHLNRAGPEIHEYDLIEVTALSITDYTAVSALARWRDKTKNRVFRPALATALGFREQGSRGHFSDETRLAEASALYPTPYFNKTSGRIEMDTKAAQGVEDQTYLSAYAANLGKFVSKISLTSTVRNEPASMELNQVYGIQYMMRNKKVTNRLLSDWTPLNPMHYRCLRLTSGLKFPWLTTKSKASFIGPIQLPAPIGYFRGITPPTRQEADLIYQDLEQIKSEYEDWS